MSIKAPAAASNTTQIQASLRPALPLVIGCKDYAQEEQLLIRVDRILGESGVEDLFLDLSLQHFNERASASKTEGGRPLDGAKSTERFMAMSERALRCNVLKHLIATDCRAMSTLFAHSPLYRWFIRSADFEVIKVPSKTAINLYANWLPEDKMDRVLRELSAAISNADKALEIGLQEALDMEIAWIDATCLEANIHFPVDWVLLRDGVRTLVKSIMTIRRHGLVHRIGNPEAFLSQINALAMAMSAGSRRKADGKKARKKVLRSLKRICKVVEEHGKRYRDMLDQEWEKSDLSRKQAEVILDRMDTVLAALPKARKQAHERIIAERQIKNEDKILSLYDPDINVIVRGKAGAEVEFGNSLFIAENADGFIFHHELCEEASPGDSKWLLSQYKKLKEQSGDRLKAVITDRGFDSKKTRDLLEAEGLFNGLCPRDSKELSRRLSEDEAFAGAMKRRGQTEGRIGILKNVFLGGVPKAKGIANRRMQVTWAVLAHNLWILARRSWKEPAVIAEVIAEPLAA